MLASLVRFLRLLSRWLFWPGVVLVIWGELTPHPPSIPGLLWDKSEHFTAYFGLAAMASMVIGLRPRLAPALLGILALGGSLEIIQTMVGRDGEWLDMLANTIGVSAGFAVAAILLALVGPERRDYPARSQEVAMFSEFKKFAMRGNVLDLAVGVIIGASFTGIVNSLVKDIIMPPIGLALGGVDFSNFFFVLKDGPKDVGPYATLADATKASAVTMNYGLFVNAVINFLIIAFVLFLLLRQMNKLMAPTPAAVEAPPPSEEILLLRDIRDSLKARG